MSVTMLVLLFLMLFAIVMIVIGLGFRLLEADKRKRLNSALAVASAAAPMPRTDILSDAPDGDRLPVLSELPFYRRMEAYIQQAGMSWTPTSVLITMAVGAVIGILLGVRVRVPVFREFAMIGFAIFLGVLPYVFVQFKRNKRMAAFEEQFPEALDFLARSMRAGHAFSVSLEMMADESPDPLGIEFRQVFNEQNLGAPIELALRNLATRVPLVDVRFFVSAVLLQRETGGNLAEILTKLGYVIRERFRLKGQVKAVSAHGRITAMILSIMPIITMILLTIIAPQYLSSMAADPDGKLLIVGAITGQFLGYIWMKNIVNIKV